MRSKTCRTCVNFSLTDSTCRLNPPVRLPRKFNRYATAGNREREEDLIWGWPVIDIEEWCGQYSQ
jgi:hypothetical protein